MNLDDTVKIGKYIFNKKHLLGTVVINLYTIVVSLIFYFIFILIENNNKIALNINSYLYDIIGLMFIGALFMLFKKDKIKKDDVLYARNYIINTAYLIIIFLILFDKHNINYNLFASSNNNFDFFLTLLLWIITLKILKKIRSFIEFIYNEIKNDRINLLEIKFEGDNELYEVLTNLYNKKEKKFLILDELELNEEILWLIENDFLKTLKSQKIENIHLYKDHKIKLYFSEETIKHFESEEAEQ